VFRQWVNQAKVTDDPVGDFIGDYRRDKTAPGEFESLARLRLYLSVRTACPEAIEAAVRAWKRYQRWLMSRDKEPAMTPKTVPQTCSQPSCANIGVIRVEDDKWLCTRHMNERVNSPRNMALADEDLESFREKGGNRDKKKPLPRLPDDGIPELVRQGDGTMTLAGHISGALDHVGEIVTLSNRDKTALADQLNKLLSECFRWEWYEAASDIPGHNIHFDDERGPDHSRFVIKPIKTKAGGFRHYTIGDGGWGHVANVKSLDKAFKVALEHAQWLSREPQLRGIDDEDDADATVEEAVEEPVRATTHPTSKF
jgi:hypothetical protein